MTTASRSETSRSSRSFDAVGREVAALALAESEVADSSGDALVLDPVFSSGVTIAFKSAQLASAGLARRYAGEAVDWEAEFSVPLRAGVKTFRRFVESWYEGGFQKIIYHPQQQPEVRDMISSILAGYAWDTNNPYVADDSGRRMRVLEQLCGA